MFVSTIFGAGLGDLNFDGQYSATDIDLFAEAFWSSNAIFNPAGDFAGDGLIGLADVYLLGLRLEQVNADQPTWDAYHTFVASIPEPGAAMVSLLTCFGSLFFRGFRRRTGAARTGNRNQKRGIS
jgi:hypothetical protein